MLKDSLAPRGRREKRARQDQQVRKELPGQPVLRGRQGHKDLPEPRGPRVRWGIRDLQGQQVLRGRRDRLVQQACKGRRGLRELPAPRVPRGRKDLRVRPARRDRRVPRGRKGLYGKEHGLFQLHTRSMMPLLMRAVPT